MIGVANDGRVAQLGEHLLCKLVTGSDHLFLPDVYRVQIIGLGLYSTGN